MTQDLGIGEIDVLDIDWKVITKLLLRRMFSRTSHSVGTHIYHGDVRTWRFPRKYDLIYWSHGPEHIPACDWWKTFSRLVANANRCFFTRFPWGSFYDYGKDHLTKSIDVPMVRDLVDGLEMRMFTCGTKNLDGGEIVIYKFKQ